MIQLVKAKLKDIEDMQAIVVDEVKDGVILKRSEDEVATNIRSYVLAKDGEKLVGYAALHIHSVRLAEIRSLIVIKEYRNQKVGQQLVEFTLKEAEALSCLQEVLVLTYLPDFFKKLHFVEIDKESIPEHKIWADCIKCIHFPVCNESSLIYRLERMVDA